MAYKFFPILIISGSHIELLNFYDFVGFKMRIFLITSIGLKTSTQVSKYTCFYTHLKIFENCG